MPNENSNITDAFMKLIEKLAEKEKYTSQCAQCGKGFRRIGAAIRNAFCIDCAQNSSTVQLIKRRRDATESEVIALKNLLEIAEKQLTSYDEELDRLGWQKDARATVKVNFQTNRIELKVYQNNKCIEASEAKIYDRFHITRVFESDLQGKVIRVPWKQIKSGHIWEQDGYLSDHYLFIKTRNEGFEPSKILNMHSYRLLPITQMKTGKTNTIIRK